MAGSRRYFRYVSDAGDSWAVELDESVYENPVLGFDQLPNQLPVLQVTSQRPVKMRYLNLVRVVSNVTERSKVYVGNPDSYTLLLAAGAVQVDGNAWGISSSVGEQRKVVPQTDTGILDGDVDDNLASGV